MGRKEKLLTKAQQNPQGLSFSDFETLLSLCGWTFKRQKGSKAKDYQIKQFLEAYGKKT